MIRVAICEDAFDENVFSEEEKSKIIKTDGNYVFIPSEQIVNELYDMDRACNVSKHAGKDDILFVVYTERVKRTENGKEIEVTRLISARYATNFERGLYYGKC